MSDDKRYALLLLIIALLIGLCGGLEQNAVSVIAFIVMVIGLLITAALLLPKRKR